MPNIPTKEIVFNSLSFADPGGRLFTWNGNLYRAISSEQTSFYLDLFEQKIIQELIERKLLIETNLTDLALDEFALVLLHRQLAFVSYPQEWCDLMFKDAALLHLDFCIALEQHDLITDDVLPYNILFDGCNPVFVDFTSINPTVALDTSVYWGFYGQFHELFLYPLQLMANGYSSIARLILRDYDRGVSPEEAAALLSKPLNKSGYRQNTSKLAVRARHYLDKINNLARSILGKTINIKVTPSQVLKRLRQEVVDIDLSNQQTTPTELQLDRFASQINLIEKLIFDLLPQSILNLSLGDASYSYTHLAVAHTQKVVCIQPEEARVRQLYDQSKAHNWSLLPILMDLSVPNGNFYNEWFAPAYQRFQCELVLAIDVVEKLVFQDQFRFDLIVGKLASFTQKWLIVNFQLKQIPYLNSASTGQKFTLAWYNLDNFISHLQNQFTQVHIITADTNQAWLLCQKKR